MPQPVKSGYAFGDCFLDVSERRLLRKGAEVPLTPKVFDTLVLLVENAGHLVEKDEFMARLWPGTFVGEDALARNISILRKSLGGSTESQGVIVTVPTRGYRFEASVRKTTDNAQPTARDVGGETQGAWAGSAFPEPAQTGTQSASALAAARTQTSSPAGAFAHRSSRALLVAIALALVLGALAGLTTFWLLSPPALPKVTGLEQLTHSGRVDPWPRLVTDGVSIYFLERQGDRWNLMRTSVAGGESQILPTPSKNAVALDVSPDRTKLLIGSFEERESRMPLWIWPVSGGAFRRVGDITAYAALWHPNGRQIVYSEDDGIYICDVDGANARKFVATDEYVGGWAWAWSPDGKVLRFKTRSESWEVDSGGKILRHFVHNAGGTPNEMGGAWSADGRYFFRDHPVGKYRKDIWGVRERSWFASRAAAPVRLTNGPISYEGMTPSKEGNTIFVVAMLDHGETIGYDSRTQQATSLLAGVCTAGLAYSPDAQWVACRTASGAILRMKPDASDRLVLADASMWGFDLQWSPDGKQVAFNSRDENSGTSIFVVPVAGATPRKMLPGDYDESNATWSPGGKRLAFTRAEKTSSTASIWILTLATNQLSRVPGSENILSPAWSPDGRYIAAIGDDRHTLMLFDTRTKEWSQLAQGSLVNGDGLAWSRDGKFLYFQDLLGKNEAVNRIRMDNRKIELAASFEGLLRNGVQRVAMTGLAPDGAFILDVDRGGADIYALHLDLP